VEVTLSSSVQTEIRDFYAAHPSGDAYPLPPGIRRHLQRGKALPPGIAKKRPPAQLQSAISLQEGYEIIEVGLDVLLVDVATSIVHDVLSNVVR